MPWNPLDNAVAGPPRAIHDVIGRAITRGQLPLFENLQPHRLWLVSDYAGEHAASLYAVYSFLFIREDNAAILASRLKRLRKAGKIPHRHYSYERLRDGERIRGVRPFFETLRRTPCTVVNIAVEKSLGTLFAPVHADASQDPVLSGLVEAYDRSVREKLGCVLHFGGLLLAGAAGAMQDVLWITDDDVIAANEDALHRLTTLFSSIAGYYLAHRLGHLRVTTTGIQSKTPAVEDLASVPDMIGGAIAECLTRNRERLSSQLVVPASKSTAGKATFVIQELLGAPSALASLTITLEHGTKRGDISITNREFFPISSGGLWLPDRARIRSQIKG